MHGGFRSITAVSDDMMCEVVFIDFTTLRHEGLRAGEADATALELRDDLGDGQHAAIGAPAEGETDFALGVGLMCVFAVWTVLGTHTNFMRIGAA
jgi:hypothetical protein